MLKRMRNLPGKWDIETDFVAIGSEIGETEVGLRVPQLAKSFAQQLKAEIESAPPVRDFPGDRVREA